MNWVSHAIVVVPHTVDADVFDSKVFIKTIFHNFFFVDIFRFDANTKLYKFYVFYEWLALNINEVK